MPTLPHAKPFDVTAEKGEVQVDGPGGVALAMTPEAAEMTAARLRDGAVVARGQRDQPRP